MARSSEDPVEVIKMTQAEWDAFVQAGLDRLGITWEELERQAREWDYQSFSARSFWLIVKPLDR